MESEETDALADLQQNFLLALELNAAGKLDKAEGLLRQILKTEPRLPEPHMELARILLETDRVGEAESHAVQALEYLENPGQWTDDLQENVVQALAHALLAEAMRRRADEDDVIFGDAAEFQRLIAESKAHFAKAAELDPRDEYSSFHAFFLGVDGHTTGAIPK